MVVGLLKFKTCALRQLQGLQLERKSFRIGQRVGYGNPHIGNPQLRKDGTILILHQRVNDRLRVDDDFDSLGGNIEQPSRLDDFQALVHESGRIDRNLLPHRPVWVLQRLLSGYPEELVHLHAAKWPSGGSQDNLLEIFFPPGFQCLKNCGVLGIDRQQANPLLPHRSHDNPARHHKCLLVGKPDILTRLDGGKSRQKSRRANHCRDSHHRCRKRRHRFIALNTEDDSRPEFMRHQQRELLRPLFIDNGDEFRPKFPYLLRQKRNIGAGSHGDYPVTLRKLSYNLKDIDTD